MNAKVEGQKFFVKKSPVHNKLKAF